MLGPRHRCGTTAQEAAPAARRRRPGKTARAALPTRGYISSRHRALRPPLRSYLDVAIELLDPGGALLVDLLPVLEDEFLLQFRGVLGENARDLAVHRHLGIGRHDQ